MAITRKQLHVGKIVWVESFRNKDGSDGYGRWVVVVYVAKAEDDNKVIGAAITTKRRPELPENSVEIPSRADGDPQTGLTRPSVVQCDWLNPINLEETNNTIFKCKGQKLDAIMRGVPEYLAPLLAKPPCDR